MEWYKKSVDEVLKELKTSRNGLDTNEVNIRLNKYGKNELPTEPPQSLLSIITQQFKNPLIYILIIAAIVAFFSGKMLDCLFIIIVIVINALLGSYQEWQAEKSSQGLKKLIQINAFALRNGQKKVIRAQSLVPGDVVMLESGDKVPADLRLIEVNKFSVNESLLTGESKAIYKITEPLPEESIIQEHKNIAHAGTIVETGLCKGVVVSTGLNTEVGKIAESVVSTKEIKTPLLIRLDNFATKISIAIFVLCLIVLGIGILQGRPAIELFFLSTALLVSAIPEGLPIAVTTALSRGSFRMANRKVIIRRLSAVEALGSCNCLASDKTGTLTINKQVVTKLAMPTGDTWTVPNNEKEIQQKHLLINQDKQTLDKLPDDILELMIIGALCNQAELKKKGKKWEHHGDEVDIALKMLLYKFHIDQNEINKSYKVTEIFPFDPQLRYMAATITKKETKTIGIKGAIETIVELCNSMRIDNKIIPIDNQKVDQIAQDLTGAGYRVLAIAKNDPEFQVIEPLGDALSKTKFTLLGLVGMHDPVRVGAKEAIQKVQGAGIDVIMITGDHPKTAFSIANKLAIADSFSQVRLGKDLEETLESKNKKENFRDIKVFARVIPAQKLQIVKLRKQLGDFVAVTGDGANDAPALKEAHLGLAMGSGTEIAKDASLAIITDDNIVSIVAGIEEGRTAYANVRKVIYLLISAGTAEVFLILGAVTFNLPIPLTSVQILWLNLVTNGIQDIALAFEPAEPFFLKGTIYSPQEGVFNSMMIKQILISGLFMGIFCLILWQIFLTNSIGEFAARNYIFLLFIILQNYHAINCKSEYQSIFRVGLMSNKILLISVIGAHFLHILCMHIPIMRSLLQIQPISFTNWLITALSAFSIVVIVEIFKKTQRKFLNM